MYNWILLLYKPDMISIPVHVVSSPCAGSCCCIVLSFALNCLEMNNILEIRNSDLVLCVPTRFVCIFYGGSWVAQ